MELSKEFKATNIPPRRIGGKFATSKFMPRVKTRTRRTFKKQERFR